MGGGYIPHPPIIYAPGGNLMTNFNSISRRAVLFFKQRYVYTDLMIAHNHVFVFICW